MQPGVSAKTEVQQQSQKQQVTKRAAPKEGNMHGWAVPPAPLLCHSVHNPCIVDHSLVNETVMYGLLNASTSYQAGAL